ncbi:MAG TPA: anti-virulence regulator CigR family protein [Candidatus Cybelea sp.]|nr:anti-virulence regulator CigR family protein [Candidatus Cybelea sp.]
MTIEWTLPMRNVMRAMLVLAAVLIGCSPASAANVTANVGVSVVFTTAERQMITQYYEAPEAAPQGNADCAGLPPGQAKKRGCTGGLPPGIAKKYARGKPLPPGIAKRFLPEDLETRLPPRPGYARVVVNNDVLLVDEATHVVLDVIRDVVNRPR